MNSDDLRDLISGLLVQSQIFSPSCEGDFSPALLSNCGIVVIRDFWATKCLTEGLQAAIQPRRHMNRSLYAIVSAALFLADLAPLVIRSHFHTVDGGGEEGRKQDA